MILNVHTYGDPVLRKNAETVTEFDDGLRTFVDDMVDTMFSDNGVGLAAPQVGDSRKIVVIDKSFGERSDDVIALINPEILEERGEVIAEEGCLSVPGIYEDVPRSEYVRVRYQDIDGTQIELEAEGFFARVIQHEKDHLDGVLFVDRLSTVKRTLLAKTLRTMAEESVNG